MLQRYNAVLKRLYNVNSTFKVQMRLDRIYDLHTAIGRPLDAFQTIHVTGTNGKGSVCWKTAAALQNEGYNVGLFMSPHITSFRERVRINSTLVSQEDVVNGMEKLFQVAETKGLEMSFFELTTLFAWQKFAEAEVDYVVLECGCGARYDATNICDPILTCITSIGFDHTSILGDTLESVCFHKAGIMKAGVPCIGGSRVPNDILERYAKLARAPYIPTKTPSSPAVFRPNAGTTDYDYENSLTVREMLTHARRQGILNLSEASIDAGLRERPPYRLEHVVAPLSNGKSVKIIFDAAHNSDAFQSLFETLGQHFPNPHGETPNIRVVLGFSSENSVEGCLQQVTKHVPVSLLWCRW